MHNVFGHDFRGYEADAWAHTQVVRTVNKILGEIDPNYEWESTDASWINTRYQR